MEEYLDFYEQIFDYIIELKTLKGVQIMEGTAVPSPAILTPNDPGILLTFARRLARALVSLPCQL